MVRGLELGTNANLAIRFNEDCADRGRRSKMDCYMFKRAFRPLPSPSLLHVFRVQTGLPTLAHTEDPKRRGPDVTIPRTNPALDSSGAFQYESLAVSLRRLITSDRRVLVPAGPNHKWFPGQNDSQIILYNKESYDSVGVRLSVSLDFAHSQNVYFALKKENIFWNKTLKKRRRKSTI